MTQSSSNCQQFFLTRPQTDGNQMIQFNVLMLHIHKNCSASGPEICMLGIRYKMCISTNRDWWYGTLKNLGLQGSYLKKNLMGRFSVHFKCSLLERWRVIRNAWLKEHYVFLKCDRNLIDWWTNSKGGFVFIFGCRAYTFRRKTCL